MKMLEASKFTGIIGINNNDNKFYEFYHKLGENSNMSIDSYASLQASNGGGSVAMSVDNSSVGSNDSHTLLKHQQLKCVNPNYSVAASVNHRREADTMLKMVIRMNDDKITAENKYRLDGIYNTINHTFQTVGLPRMEDGSGALVFRDCGRARDFSLFGRIVNTLKRQTWFMDNVSVWRLCDSDDSDSPDDFNEEDLLTHYQEKTAMRA